jgi:hypothetical protein
MKAIRIIAIVLMGLTAVVNVLGGAGTSCAAFAPDKWDATKPLIPFQRLYQVLVFTVIAVGLAGVWTTYALIRTQKSSYAGGLIVLIVGIALAVIQMTAWRALRGKSMPTDFRLYAGVITLVVFLLLRLPGVWQQSSMGGSSGASGSWRTPAGTALMVMGIAVLTVPLWAGDSHTLEGYDWVYVWEWQLLLSGVALVLGGAALLVGRYLQAGDDALPCRLHALALCSHGNPTRRTAPPGAVRPQVVISPACRSA